MSEATNPHHQAALDEIIALATDLCRRIHAAAIAPEPELTLDEAALALDRTARIVRRTVLLSSRLHALKPQATARTANRKQLIRAVEHAIHTVTRHDPDRHDALRAELHERLDREDLDHDILTRPVPELIEELKQDLGVAFQGQSFTYPRRTPADLDALNHRASSPLPAKQGPGTACALPRAANRDPTPPLSSA